MNNINRWRLFTAVLKGLNSTATKRNDSMTQSILPRDPVMRTWLRIYLGIGLLGSFEE